MIAANVGTWERSCVCFADAGLEALGCQEEVYLVVNLPIRDMPGCYPRQLVGVGSVGKDESVALCELKESPSSVICLSNAKIFLLSLPSAGRRQCLPSFCKSSYCSCPVLVGVSAYRASVNLPTVPAQCW